jgi:putative oxidoreductase
VRETVVASLHHPNEAMPMSVLSATPTARQIDLALLLVRLAVGAIFIAHGAQKIFVYGFAGVAGSFGQMGVPMAEITGPLVAIVEFVGGIALVLGLLTRLAAIALAIDMLGAMLLVHLAGGFFLPAGVEFALLLFLACLALAIAGAGALSIDHSVAGRRTTVGVR